MHMGRCFVSKQYKRLFLALGLVLLIYCLSFIYRDILVTGTYSFTFLDCLFSGRIRDFYTLAIADPRHPDPAVYNPPMYIIFGLWNLPIWGLIKAEVVSEMGLLSMLWCKLLLLFSLLACAYLVEKILQKLQLDRVDFYLFLMLSSLLVVVPCLAIAQYDSISLVFMLWGLWLCIKKDRIDWKVLLLFSVAVSLKFFALFVFAILLLLREKRILPILLNMAAVMLVTLVSTLPYLGDESYHASVSVFTAGMLNRTLFNVLPGMESGISLFFLFSIAVLILAYVLHPEDRATLVRDFAWLTASFFLVFFLFVQYAYPYWIIMMLPFLVLALAFDPSRFKLKMILLNTMELCFITISAFNYHWVLLHDTALTKLIFRRMPVISDRYGIENMRMFVEPFHLLKTLPALNAVFAASGLALLLLCAPWWKQRDIREDGEIQSLNRATCVFRLSVIILYFVLSFAITYFI